MSFIAESIQTTLEFFAAQDVALTAHEVYTFLLWPKSTLRNQVNSAGELTWRLPEQLGETAVPYTQDQITRALQTMPEVNCFQGYYFLKTYQPSYQLEKKYARNTIETDEEAAILARMETEPGFIFAYDRWVAYRHALLRHQRIVRYTNGIRHIPFIRGVGIVGSQALGRSKPDSDIDMLIFTEPNKLWMARMCITFYFQILGVRRHGDLAANRFCLNHYLEAGTALKADCNLYTALEYTKMIPLFGGRVLADFIEHNQVWISLCVQNPEAIKESIKKIAPALPQPSSIQRMGEWLLQTKLGLWMQEKFKQYQYHRIEKNDFIIVSNTELSFHPHNRKADLFARFFKNE